MPGRYNVRRSGPVAPSWGPKSTLTAAASARSRSVPGYRIQHLHRHDQDAAETFPRAGSAGRASQAIRGSDFNLVYAKKDSSSAHSCAISLSAGRFGRVAQGGRNGPSRESRGRPARSSGWRPSASSTCSPAAAGWPTGGRAGRRRHQGIVALRYQQRAAASLRAASCKPPPSFFRSTRSLTPASPGDGFVISARDPRIFSLTGWVICVAMREREETTSHASGCRVGLDPPQNSEREEPSCTKF